ncbi:MAG TPA: hybrid sensor histidine kinase/response regulator [Ktedonobacteraceae bacterium]|jgi:two-component system sensor histidine kinase/response regulator|nr:hybrid sensor histidine kinase/response regulator [Ktedonobacteraceae bacterium]
MTDRPHILIVDDDPALLQALPQTLYLRIPGVQVDTSDTALEALKQIQEHDYDAIISDIKMPGMDGLALLTKIKELRPETPTLLITGHGEHELAIQALRGGAYDYIQKPIDREYCINALLRAVQMRQLRHQVKEQQLALEMYAMSLEQKVQERTAELIRANAAKDEFLNVVSHELKTPLASMKGMIQLLHRQFAREGSDNLRSVELIERSIHRMEMLVKDLLDISLIETEKLILRAQRSDVCAICQDTLDEFIAGTHPTPPVTLQVPDESIEVELDADRIGQVILNLLSNAYKYSPPGSPITMTVERTGDVCRISVHDKGLGISAEQQAHIFDRFYRVPGNEVQTGSHVGLGLGLYISNKIVEQHGGRIEVQSTPDKGSTFSIVLPLSMPTEDSKNGYETSHSSV